MYDSSTIRLKLLEKRRVSTYLLDRLAYLRMLKMGVPLNSDIIDTISIIELLSDSDIVFHFPLVIDPNELFLNYLLKKYSQDQVVLEAYTVDGGSSTEVAVEEALRDGLILIVKDADDKLMRAVAPIVEWR